jgi:hypothetical protein
MFTIVKAFFGKYSLFIYLAIAAAIVSYILVLKIELSYKESKIIDLRANLTQWKIGFKVLSDSVDNQNKAVDELSKATAAIKLAAADALKAASKANSIRQPKINAATERLNALVKTDCITAIAEAKKELQP